MVKKLVLVSVLWSVFLLTACDETVDSTKRNEIEVTAVEETLEEAVEEANKYGSPDDASDISKEDYEYEKLKRLQNEGVSTFEELEPEILDGINYERYKAVCDIFHDMSTSTFYLLGGKTAYFEDREVGDGYYFSHAWLSKMEEDEAGMSLGYRVHIEGYHNVLSDRKLNVSKKSLREYESVAREILVATEDMSVLAFYVDFNDYIEHAYRILKDDMFIWITTRDIKGDTVHKDLIDGLVEEIEEKLNTQ